MDLLTRLLADQAAWLAAVLVGSGLILILRFGPPLLRKRPSPVGAPAPKPREAPIIPSDILLQAQPLLTQTEAALYNLLCLAVKEHFLVFAQVPLWCLVDIRAGNRASRSAFLQQVAFKRAQFVVVHPGTLRVERVVELDDPADLSPQKQARDRLFDAIFRQARIPVVRLDTQQEYTVAVLAGLLGVVPEDSDG